MLWSRLGVQDWDLVSVWGLPLNKPLLWSCSYWTFSPWGYTGVNRAITPPWSSYGLQHQLLGLFANLDQGKSCEDPGLSSPWGKNQKPVLHDETQNLLCVWCHHMCYLACCICVISRGTEWASVGLQGTCTVVLLIPCWYCHQQMLTLSLPAQPHSGLMLQLFMCFKLQEKKKNLSKNAFPWVYTSTGQAAVSKDIFSFLTAIGKGIFGWQLRSNYLMSSTLAVCPVEAELFKSKKVSNEVAQYLILQMQQVIKHWASWCLGGACQHQRGCECAEIPCEPLTAGQDSSIYPQL